MTQQTQLTKLMLVMDADRTLTPCNSGNLFWQHEGYKHAASPLKDILFSQLDYSHAAFRQAAAPYDERYNADALNGKCQEIASKIELHPEMAALIHRAREEKDIGAVVVTCGLLSVVVVGMTLLSMEGPKKLWSQLSASCTVLECIAFGDSVLDLAMLVRADRALVVVGSEDQRSTRMENELSLTIRDGQLKAKQAALSKGAPPRLDVQMLPKVDLGDPMFLAYALQDHSIFKALRFIHKNKSVAAKLLMTPTRDATKTGPAMRAAHEDVGWYLATAVLPKIRGLEDYAIPHVQGHIAEGYRIRNESRTLIVALMRGGEPMAFGVTKALPRAAKPPQDITAAHVNDVSTVILVDSVVNSGKSLIEFMERLDELGSTATIIMIAGVVQSGARAAIRSAMEHLRYSDLTLIALRQSENKYTGKGGTDTGNRLFNTISLDQGKDFLTDDFVIDEFRGFLLSCSGEYW